MTTLLVYALCLLGIAVYARMEWVVSQKDRDRRAQEKALWPPELIDPDSTREHVIIRRSSGVDNARKSLNIIQKGG